MTQPVTDADPVSENKRLKKELRDLRILFWAAILLVIIQTTAWWLT